MSHKFQAREPIKNSLFTVGNPLALFVKTLTSSSLLERKNEAAMGRKVCNLARKKLSCLLMMHRSYQKVKLMKKENRKRTSLNILKHFGYYTLVRMK